MIQSFELNVNTLGPNMKVFLFQADDMLIDSGPKRMAKQVQEILSERTINEVVYTHHHEDHTGNALWIEKYLKVSQWIHPSGVKLCKEKTRLPFYRAMTWNNREAFHPLPLEQPYIETKNYFFKIVHTPGHAIDHIVLIDEEHKICFSGDLYLYHSPTAHFSFESVPEIIRSLDKTLSYSFRDVYCSHTGFIPEGRKLLEWKRDNLFELQEKVRESFQKGKTERQIKKELFPKNKMFQYISMFENSPMHTIRSILKEAENV
ncbi:MBL fold metallo-hydrolase [Bacillus carboniphilus]|uniref:MBL fold metallo-hydrolase n=1 Tax=Bacillus carboniphilus TaxID=86663 RepID=A0ABY9JYQ6_9BACI|nr:MBL fold metallo-hydrolase [Bacillus carboniphilus]WLR42725.1 MBL fold metallo-hydrolase [Bacillus carboniphilus]